MKTEAQVPEVKEFSGEQQFYASRYRQGGRVVYSLDLSLEQVGLLVRKPDPDKVMPGNRGIRLKHAQDFAKYVRARNDWVAPSIILRAPAMFTFDRIAEVSGAEFGVLSFPQLRVTDINILDGQHRILGIHLANEAIQVELARLREARSTARKFGDTIAEKETTSQIKKLEAQRDRLAKERINVQIHVVEDPAAYRQMFFDIADNALGITASVKARFDSRKVVNRALESVAHHPMIDGFMELERDNLAKGSPYLVSAKHVTEIIRAVNVGIDGRVSAIQERQWHEAEVAEKANRFLDLLPQCFTAMRDVKEKHLTPEGLRASSLLGSVLFVRVLAGVFHELAIDREWDDALVAEFFAKLDKHTTGPVYEGSIWLEHGKGLFDDGAFAPRGRRQDQKALVALLVEWAILKPEFLDAEPAPRPKTIEEIEAEEIEAERAALSP